MPVTADKPKERSRIQPRRKRKPVMWWQCDPPALCPECGVPCVAVNTAQTSESHRTQYRKCPDCGHTMKTIIEG